MAPQLACGHVLDHALTQRADGGIGTHGELLLSEVLRPRSFLRTGLPAPTMVSSRLATNPRSGTPRSGLSRQRFSAMSKDDPGQNGNLPTAYPLQTDVLFAKASTVAQCQGTKALARQPVEA